MCLAFLVLKHYVYGIRFCAVFYQVRPIFKNGKILSEIVAWDLLASPKAAGRSGNPGRAFWHAGMPGWASAGRCDTVPMLTLCRHMCLHLDCVSLDSGLALTLNFLSLWFFAFFKAISASSPNCLIAKASTSLLLLLLLLSRFSHVRLCDPIDGSPPGSSVPGILQARILEWVAISFSKAWKGKVKVKLLSRARLLATPWTGAYQATSLAASNIHLFFCSLFVLSFFFLITHGLWDLSSQIKDWTQVMAVKVLSPKCLTTREFPSFVWFSVYCIYLTDQGLNPGPLHWDHRVLAWTTREILSFHFYFLAISCHFS